LTSFGALLGDLNAAGLLDVVVGIDESTEAALEGLMSRWGATRPDGSVEDRRLPSPGWPLHLRTAHGLIDILAAQAPPLDLEGLLARSDTRLVDGVRAPICSLADLVAMKRQGGRPTDHEDLNRLETVHGELPPTPE
jgi:hypothetical protein